METYYRDSFAWESLPKYFNVSRFRMEDEQIKRIMKETFAWSKDYLSFSKNSSLIIEREYDLNADLVRSVVADEVFKGRTEYFVDAYRIRDNPEGRTEVKFLFSQKEAITNRRKIDELIERIDRELENVEEMKIFKSYENSKKKVYDSALDIFKKRRFGYCWKVTGKKDEEFLDIEIPLARFFTEVRDFDPSDDVRVIRARFKEDNDKTQVYFIVHKEVPYGVKTYIKGFFKYLDKILQESPELSIEISDLKEVNSE